MYNFISYDWRDHPMGRLTKRLVTSHNTSTIHTTCISYATEHTSSIYTYVKQHATRFVDISNITSDTHAAEYIYEHVPLDILIDITSHTYNNRITIAALKPAPIVINYLGWPGTTGCRGFAYSIGRHCSIL